jgi:hypothetical protein
MDALVNSPKFKNFEFLAKTESRFTQVTCNVAANSKVKLSFNDSRMLLTDSLASLAKAWISPGLTIPSSRLS